MLKYLSKFTMDILPSVAATIIGAYIVNHYITAKPEAPVAAALSSPGSGVGAKPAAKSPDEAAHIPESGIRAKGISERAIFGGRATADKTPVEKPAEKSAEKPQERPEETASISAESRRHLAAPREKTAIRTIPLTASVATATDSTAAPAPAPAAATNAPKLEAAIAPDEHHDATDLARAAIERLRGVNDGAPRAQEASRPSDLPRVASTPPAAATQVSAPQIAAPSVRPLPPPIMVSAPPSDTGNAGAGASQPVQQASTGSVRVDDPRRPTPPADIPGPVDLRAEAVDLSPPAKRENRTVADDMLSAAKSVFHAVLPQ